ncbi:hypothetical protein UAY_03317 [Enterococcus moraviensis ATCC BAA-383]|uniref:Uncharacterized protein n=1 Tax=Enterococcus moraviensis ATCC BAA-383 TaxID=1158609 RepID=R2SSW3_9ENTE|nr:hypothetical protein [Enterococcus moraviensis]EOH95891.1 hypothetical protein UAY_03317 [Enterococcus moraviensis ATCC BAA-383]EOT66378.1 hypothetical protein I586_02649 [Enterococcus moraviensis ATCC BAA-383]OJG67558.1 hypothetical protein RV09_GL002327 [Enterococcus moraviensis]
MTNQNEKIEALKLENENLRLRLATIKEDNKSHLTSWVWVLVPVMGMLVSLVNNIF